MSVARPLAPIGGWTFIHTVSTPGELFPGLPWMPAPVTVTAFHGIAKAAIGGATMKTPTRAAVGGATMRPDAAAPVMGGFLAGSPNQYAVLIFASAVFWLEDAADNRVIADDYVITGGDAPQAPIIGYTL